MRKIRHTETLVYYDGALVFEGRDSIGGHYIGTMTDNVAGRDRYLVAGVAPGRLERFRTGKLDLRTLLEEAGKAEWRFADVDDIYQEALTLTLPANPDECELFLPDEGFFLGDDFANDSVLHEARERGNIVLELRTAPPEAADAPRIRAATLSGLLTRMQTLVMHAYREAAPGRTRRTDEGHAMNVVVPAAGSFRVFLEAAGKGGPRGERQLRRGLERLGELFENPTRLQDAPERARAHGVRLARACINFVNFLEKNDTALGYAWAAPDFENVRRVHVSDGAARKPEKENPEYSKLERRDIAISGKLSKVDTKSGVWELDTPYGPRIGKIHGRGPDLNGLIIGGRYEFHCTEEIQRTRTAGIEKEKRTLHLEKIESA